MLNKQGLIDALLFWCIVVLAAPSLAAFVAWTAGHAGVGVHVRGPLTATRPEADQGVFHMGDALVVAVDPKGPIVVELRKMVGRTVQLSVVARNE